MSEGIIVALISVAGAIIGAAITAFGSIAAAERKNNGSQMGCGLLGFIASAGALGGLVLGAVFAVLLTQFTGPTPPSEPQYPTPQPSTRGNVLEPLIINGISYQVPNYSAIQCLGGSKSERQTGADTSLSYTLRIPTGWYIVWDSYQASWTPNNGQYTNEGLLAIYGPWEGTVNINTGEYCAVPVEWADFAWENRKNAWPVPNGRLECVINNGLLLNSECQ